MIDDVMSAPPFTLFPSSFLHRSFLLLLAGSRGSNPPRAEHRARGTQSSSFPLLPLSPPPLLVLCFLLSPSRLPLLISPSFSVTRKRPIRPPPHPFPHYFDPLPLRNTGFTRIHGSVRCLSNNCTKDALPPGSSKTGKCPVPRELCQVRDWPQPFDNVSFVTSSSCQGHSFIEACDRLGYSSARKFKLS